VTQLCSQHFSLENDPVCLTFCPGHIALRMIHFHMSNPFSCPFDVGIFCPALYTEISLIIYALESDLKGSRFSFPSGIHVER
jgi:hypothetical protein